MLLWYRLVSEGHNFSPSEHEQEMKFPSLTYMRHHWQSLVVKPLSQLLGLHSSQFVLVAGWGGINAKKKMKMNQQMNSVLTDASSLISSSARLEANFSHTEWQTQAVSHLFQAGTDTLTFIYYPDLPGRPDNDGRPSAPIPSPWGWPTPASYDLEGTVM